MIVSKSLRIRLALVCFAALLMWSGAAVVAGAAPLEAETTRVSVSSVGVQADYGSSGPDMTPDGRYVAFHSVADNLAGGDGDTTSDVFVYDRVTRVTELISVSSSEVKGNMDSDSPSISDDGRYVAFASGATNLVSGDTNARVDVFVRDRVKGTTTRVSIRVLGAVLTQGNGDSTEPKISGDGKVVAYTSAATNLVLNDENAVQDVFVKEWQTAGTSLRVSLSTSENEGDGTSNSPAISQTGRYVAFDSAATNLVADTNGHTDVFVRDRTLGTTIRASVTGVNGQSVGGNSFDPAISADGRAVAFTSAATNLSASDTNGSTDVFVRYLDSHSTVTASVRPDDVPGNGNSGSPVLDSKGYYVAFSSWATDLMGGGDTNGEWDIFVRDLASGTWRVNLGPGGAQATGGGSFRPSMAENGGAVAFYSHATNLVGGDTNGSADVFVHSAVWAAPIEQDDGALTFDRWVQGFNDSYTAGGYVYGRWANTNLEVKFYGEGVNWIGPKQPGYGKAEVWLDGVYRTTVDCYEAAPGTLSAWLWHDWDLAPGYHTLRIKCLGTKNAASTGTVVVVDQIKVNTNDTGPIAARYDEQDWRGSFAGTWIKATNPTYFAKGYAYSSWSGTTYTASFFGSKVAWIGPKTTAYGKAAVYVDGAYKATVDCYSATTGWRYKIWESAALTRGSHYIQIKPLHTKRAASTNYAVVVDAMDVSP